MTKTNIKATAPTGSNKITNLHSDAIIKAQKSKNSTGCSRSKKNEENISSSNEAGLSTIDDLFASKKKEKIKRKERESSEKLNDSNAAEKKSKKCHVRDRSELKSIPLGTFVDDGLGGVFNNEGYTGRVDEGVKVFKAHLFNKEGFGSGKDCPFDCDCCYI